MFSVKLGCCMAYFMITHREAKRYIGTIRSGPIGTMIGTFCS
jgi:hypothetical protein